MKAFSLDLPQKFVFESVSRSEVGCIRAANEDRLLDRPEIALWAIADGMGGQARGSEAATRVIAALKRVEPSVTGYAMLADIERNLDGANREMFDLPGGSTVAVLLIHDGHYACLWAGDSRIYRVRANHLEQITRDHSIVQQLVDSGALGEDERCSHPGAHVITRAIGVQQFLVLDRRFAQIETGDRFLLCSDGLTACLTNLEIEEILCNNDLAQAAEHLVRKSLLAGAPDNFSFVLLNSIAIQPTP